MTGPVEAPPVPTVTLGRPAKKPLLPALSGLRAFAALNIVFFHFSNPKWFGPFAPIIDNGYTSVSFFLLMSGFILAYNYSDRAQRGELKARNFWTARLSRLYPIYVFTLLLSLGMLMEEWHARSHSQFFLGLSLTPLLLQGWLPKLATFWNTPAWTMSTEAFFYLIFPLVIRWKRPERMRWLLLTLLGLWAAGMVLPGLYLWLHPDGVLHINRYTDGFWIRALKFTPPPHLPSFFFGIVLADVDARLGREGHRRLLLGIAGVAGLYAVLYFGDSMPFPMMHDGLLMPLFGLAILGLAGRNLIASFFGFWPFLAVGQASYCLYLMHFNLWQLIHESGVLKATGLARFDPWLSYLLLILSAVAAMVLIERPAQKWIRNRAARRLARLRTVEPKS